METRNPVEDYFGSELPAINNHCGVFAVWSLKMLKILRFFLLFFGKTTPYGKIFIFCSESFHRDIDRRDVFKFRKIWPTGNRCNRAYLPDKKNKIWAASQAVATKRIAPKICQVQPPTMYSECSRFHPNRFTFGGVIAERVNTAKTRRKVNPIFGWSIASSRIIICLLMLAYILTPMHCICTACRCIMTT